MAPALHAVSIDAADPDCLAAFWTALLGWEPAHETGDGIVLASGGATGFGLRFVPEREPKATPNLRHFDLTSARPQGQQQTVARVLELGGRHVDVGQRPEEGHVVLGDPEGNELCVVGAGNRFLADCGFVGALACDGTRAVGCFWSRALGWPLVWDQDEETAVQSPRGGPKVPGGSLSWSISRSAGPRARCRPGR